MNHVNNFEYPAFVSFHTILHFGEWMDWHCSGKNLTKRFFSVNKSQNGYIATYQFCMLSATELYIFATKNKSNLAYLHDVCFCRQKPPGMQNIQQTYLLNGRRNKSARWLISPRLALDNLDCESM